MSGRGVLIRSDSMESLTDYLIDLPSSPRPPRSPHLHSGRIDYFDRSLRGKVGMGYLKHIRDERMSDIQPLNVVSVHGLHSSLPMIKFRQFHIKIGLNDSFKMNNAYSQKSSHNLIHTNLSNVQSE